MAHMLWSAAQVWVQAVVQAVHFVHSRPQRKLLFHNADRKRHPALVRYYNWGNILLPLLTDDRNQYKRYLPARMGYYNVYSDKATRLVEVMVTR
jgi:hypothetical protein